MLANGFVANGFWAKEVLILKKGLLLTAVLLLIVPVILSAQQLPFLTSTQLTNGWRWLPASGNPDSYIVEIQKSEVWTVYATVPATVSQDGYVHTSIISPGIEIYRIRVTATDAAGNQGPPSDPSTWVLVFPSLTGRPELE